MNQKERLELAKWAMNYALKHGADQVSVRLFNQREVSIEYRDKRMEELKESTQNSLNADIYADQKYSSHSTNDLRKDSLEKFLDEAIAATKYLTRDEYRSLADPKYYPKGKGADIQIYDPAYHDVESSTRVRMAEEIESVAMDQSDDIISVSSWYEDTYTQTCMVNSKGFEGEAAGTRFGAGAEVTVRDGDEGRPADYYWASTRFMKDLPTTDDLGKWAVERAVRKIGQKNSIRANTTWSQRTVSARVSLASSAPPTRPGPYSRRTRTWKGSSTRRSRRSCSRLLMTRPSRRG